MVFDREASLERLAERTAEAAAAGAEPVVFPGMPARLSVLGLGQFLAGWADAAKPLRPARRAVGRVPGPRRRPARRGGGERRPGSSPG